MLVRRAFGAGDRMDATLAGAFELYTEYYLRHPAVHANWMPGAREALDACAGLPLALATNKGRAATLAVLHALGMTARFSSIVAGGDGPLKPDPAAILAAVAPMGVSPKDAWVVGDGPQDIGAGRAAGSYTIGILGGFAREPALREALPDRLLPSLHRLPELVRSAMRVSRTRAGASSLAGTVTSRPDDVRLPSPRA